MIVINLILLEFMEVRIMVKELFGKRIKVFLFLSIKLNSCYDQKSLRLLIYVSKIRRL